MIASKCTSCDFGVSISSDPLFWLALKGKKNDEENFDLAGSDRAIFRGSCMTLVESAGCGGRVLIPTQPQVWSVIVRGTCFVWRGTVWPPHPVTVSHPRSSGSGAFQKNLIVSRMFGSLNEQLQLLIDTEVLIDVGSDRSFELR